MSRRKLVGIVDQTASGWTAGRSYTEALLRSLLLAADDSIELVRLAEPAPPNGKPDAFDALPVRTHRFPGTTVGRLGGWVERRLGSAAPQAAFEAARLAGRAAQRLGRSELLSEAARLGLSVLLPIGALWSPVSFGTIGWIPDFQHVYEPRFFSAQELAGRDRTYSALAKNASRMMLSSRTACAHYAAFAPAFADKGRVASFPSTFVFRDLPSEHGSAVGRYGLPPKFALVVNQFWQHKNHLAVVEAVAKARDLGVEVPVVMAGVPADYRDPENDTVSRVLQRIAELRVGGLVHVLGKLPFADLIDLLRSAAVVVQPSRFEGWSTTVEDAKALGRPVICSGIDVHREQAPRALGFFGCDDPEALARILAKEWSGLEAGRGKTGEVASLELAKQGALEFGRTVSGICQELG